MATFDDIKTNIQESVPELTNTSASSVFQRIAYIFSSVIDTIVTEMNNTILTIQTSLSYNRFGKPLSYVDAAYYYQVGDTLLFDANYLPYYATIDPTKHLIASAAFEEVIYSVSGGYRVAQITLKVAKLSGTDLVALTAEELAAFDGYMDNFRLSGVYLYLLSLDAEVIKLANVRVAYSSSYNLDTIKTNIANALSEFRKQKKYNSILYLNEISTYVKNNVPGIVDFYIGDAYIQSNGDWTLIDASVSLPAGYFNFFDNFNLFTYVAVN